MLRVYRVALLVIGICGAVTVCCFVLLGDQLRPHEPALCPTGRGTGAGVAVDATEAAHFSSIDLKQADYEFHDEGKTSDVTAAWRQQQPSLSAGAVDMSKYAKEGAQVLSWLRTREQSHTLASTKPFRFHVYNVPDKYVNGAIHKLEDGWKYSFCNRNTTYTMLDWRHAHSLFTADVFIAKYLRLHPSHTADPNEADVFVIPMMTHVYNCAGLNAKSKDGSRIGYMIEVLSWVMQFPYYKLYNQHDHFIFWWRWGMRQNHVLRFWSRVMRYMPNVNLISFDFLEIMGRNEFQDFSLALKPKFLPTMNSIVVPYPDFSPHLITPVADAHAERSTFFYFAGTSTIGGIRRWIKRACESHPSDCVYGEFAKNVLDVKRKEVPEEYPAMMRRSLFCGHAAGDALSSRRPTSAVLAGCIPVLICDLCLYAWENFVDYSSFAVFVEEDDVINGKLFDVLRRIPSEKVRAMQRNLLAVRKLFVYNATGPPSEGDALDMLVRELSLRGSLLRQYRRWFVYNQQLSSDARDYPADPPPKKRYLMKGRDAAADARDFNNLRA